jgi:hypothetical protein
MKSFTIEPDGQGCWKEKLSLSIIPKLCELRASARSSREGSRRVAVLAEGTLFQGTQELRKVGNLLGRHVTQQQVGHDGLLLRGEAF